LDSVLGFNNAQAIHPGFGFLSENYHFSQACLDNNITFIGPPPEPMFRLGDKIRSKQLARNAGVSTVPGFAGEISSVDMALEIGM